MSPTCSRKSPRYKHYVTNVRIFIFVRFSPFSVINYFSDFYKISMPRGQVIFSPKSHALALAPIETWLPETRNQSLAGKQQKAVTPFRITAFLFRNATSLCLRVFFLQLSQRRVFVHHVFADKNRCNHQVRVDELHGRIKGEADRWRVDDAKQGQNGRRRARQPLRTARHFCFPSLRWFSLRPVSCNPRSCVLLHRAIV